MLKALMLIAVLGHLLCGICDCLLIYTSSGKFSFQLMKNNDKMREAFRTMPLRNPMLSMLLGVLALLMSSGGYFALCLWMRQFSVTAAVIMLIAAALFPLRIGGAGNWAGAVMFLGLLFLIEIDKGGV